MNLSCRTLLPIALAACLAAPAFAQADRPACVVLSALDLKPLLGSDHDAPVPFGESSCRAEAKKPGRMVILLVMQKSPEEVKKWLAEVRKMSGANPATIISEPSLGPDGFSVIEKGQRRGAEFYALKGGSAMVVQADWAIGAGLTDTDIGQLRGVAQAALGKLR
jgi:hypothetical protein